MYSETLRNVPRWRKRDRLVHYSSIAELADLFNVPVDIVERYVRNGIHPVYMWPRRWKQPRWHPDQLTEWGRIVADVDPATLPTNPPRLQRPVRIMGRCRKPTKRDCEIARRMAGLPDEIEN
jgi:hypothetical protein